MKFDTVIIGGGLAGLVLRDYRDAGAAIALASRGDLPKRSAFFLRLTGFAQQLTRWSTGDGYRSGFECAAHSGTRTSV